ncbi:MAG: hypothetical protein Solumvirus5_27 [Solumvirus sp.]|uniref:Uncharacterized protein n=1 Tax=Solumvirus sp. TaxID=2487773 RepID=A0A3G5AGV8_9VIRU|nr:MAG: hypothetical protein Solumvirus5_27 [Solumvirus sp.]
MCSTGNCGKAVFGGMSRPAIQYNTTTAYVKQPTPVTTTVLGSGPALPPTSLSPVTTTATIPGCAYSTIQQVTTSAPAATANRLGTISGSTTSVSTAATGCCTVPGPNNENIAPVVPTQFRPNSAISFTDYAGRTSGTDQVMQTTCVVSGWYTPDSKTYQNLPAGLQAYPSVHTFMKVSLMTMLFGNIVIRNTSQSNSAYQQFSVDIPVPGLPPANLAGTVTAVLAGFDQTTGTETPQDVVPVVADLPPASSAASNLIRMTITMTGILFATGSRLDLNFALSYISNPVA